MRKIFNILPSLLLLSALSCSESEPGSGEQTPRPFRIEPIITRATDVDFEAGDRLGVNILRGGSLWADNAALDFDGEYFSSDLCWYLEAEDSCTVLAWYPYASEGAPSRFSVQTDQSSGIGSSDLMTSCKHGVYPGFNAVDMVFRHRLTKLWAQVANFSGEQIESVFFDGVFPSADVDLSTGSVQADTLSEKVSITACRVKGDTLWQAITVPQTAAMQFGVKLSSGKTLVQNLQEMPLESGTRYNVSVVVYNDNLRIITSGQIQPWLEGGDIQGVDPVEPEKPDFEEFEDHFDYFGVSYPTVKLKDGKTWMAQNLRYVPEGMTPCCDTSDHWAGLYCPVASSVMTDDPEVVEAQGYLYTADVYLGLKFTDIRTEEDVKAVEGTQGICPPGWHIPTQEDWHNLVGKLVDVETNADAPYYSTSKSNSVLSDINADGFNLQDCGYLVFSYSSANTYRCQLGKSNPFFAGSTLAYDKSGKVRINFFKDGDTGQDAGEPGSIKSIMLRGLLVFPNNDTCNGSNIQYTGAYPVRCVKP